MAFAFMFGQYYFLLFFIFQLPIPTTSLSSTILPSSFPYNQIIEKEYVLQHMKLCKKYASIMPCDEDEPCRTSCSKWAPILRQPSKVGGRSLHYLVQYAIVNGTIEWPNITLSAVSILFVPGNGASFNDLHLIIAHLLFQTASRNFHFFAFDFEHEPTAYDTDTIMEQSAFIAQAIGYIHRKGLPNNFHSEFCSPLPAQLKIILFAHSMGGVSAKLALIDSNEAKTNVAFLITLASPIAEAPFYFDASFVNLMDKLNQNVPTVPIISFHSGLGDRIIDEDWTTIPRGGGNRQYSIGIEALDGRISNFIIEYTKIDEAYFFGNFSKFVFFNFNWNITGMDQQIGNILAEKSPANLMAKANDFSIVIEQIVNISTIQMLFGSKQLNLRHAQSNGTNQPQHLSFVPINFILSNKEWGVFRVDIFRNECKNQEILPNEKWLAVAFLERSRAFFFVNGQLKSTDMPDMSEEANLSSISLFDTHLLIYASNSATLNDSAFLVLNDDCTLHSIEISLDYWQSFFKFIKRNRQILPASILVTPILLSSIFSVRLTNLRTIVLPFSLAIILLFIVSTFLRYRSLLDLLLLAAISLIDFLSFAGLYLFCNLLIISCCSKLKCPTFSLPQSSSNSLIWRLLNICHEIILASIFLSTLLTFKTFLLVPLCIAINIQQFHYRFGQQHILISSLMFFQLFQFVIIIPYLIVPILILLQSFKLHLDLGNISFIFDIGHRTTFREQFFSPDPFCLPNLLLIIFTFVFCFQEFLNQKIKLFAPNCPIKLILLQLFLTILAISKILVYQQSQISLEIVSFFNVLFLIIMVIFSSE